MSALFRYYVTFKNGDGYGSAEPYTTYEPLTTSRAMVDLREALARAAGSHPDRITILMVHPLPDEAGGR